MKGERKIAVNRQTQLLLLLGFIFAVWMKADIQYYIAFALFVTGSGGLFMWGNVQVHRATNGKTPAKEGIS